MKISREQINHLKKEYPPGTEILLIQMNDDPNPIPPNTKGVVYHVDDIGTIHCGFPEINRSLGVVPGEDSFKKIQPKEVQSADEKPNEEHPLLIGYGKLEYGKTLHSEKEVAEFIIKNGLEDDVIITDALDLPFITTCGPYIFKAVDQDYLQNKLFPVLVPMQENLMAGDEDPDDNEEESTNDQTISM